MNPTETTHLTVEEIDLLITKFAITNKHLSNVSCQALTELAEYLASQFLPPAQSSNIGDVKDEYILESLEIHILNNEHDWNRNPQAMFRDFKNSLKYLRQSNTGKGQGVTKKKNNCPHKSGTTWRKETGALCNKCGKKLYN